MPHLTNTERINNIASLNLNTTAPMPDTVTLKYSLGDIVWFVYEIEPTMALIVKSVVIDYNFSKMDGPPPGNEPSYTVKIWRTKEIELPESALMTEDEAIAEVQERI